MTIWRDAGRYGRLCREIINETGSRAICHVWTRQNARRKTRDGTEPWPQGEANFRLILQAPQTLEALREIAEGAIVSSEQPPEKIAEQTLRVLRIAREAAAEYMVNVGTQQQRAEQAEGALEAIQKVAGRILEDVDTPTRTRRHWRAVERHASAAIAAVVKPDN